MIVWILNHYATNMLFDHGGRHYELAKHMIKAGYKVRIFCASSFHNNDGNIIDNKDLFHEDACDGLPFVFVRTRNYTGNGKQRILNMIDYYCNVQKAASHFERPDVIIGSSVHPLACVAAIRLAKKLRCKRIAEIRDLWPESIVAHGVASKHNILIKLLYKLEKWIYTKADSIIFTMEGGRDYIVEKGWDKGHGGSIDLEKVHNINNGVDNELYQYNLSHFRFDDLDLDDRLTFKVVYTGSLRYVNEKIMPLFEAAKRLQDDNVSDIKILIFGAGQGVERILRYLEENGIKNVIYKGRVEKKYIPYILSKCDACVLNCEVSDVVRYGTSQNKLFEYMASGKPIISGDTSHYSIVRNMELGVTGNFKDADELKQAILKLYTMNGTERKDMESRLNSASIKFDYANLTSKLLTIIND